MSSNSKVTDDLVQFSVFCIMVQKELILSGLASKFHPNNVLSELLYCLQRTKKYFKLSFVAG